MGYSYEEIRCLLTVNHNVVVSLRQLKRLLKSYGLFRRKYYSDELDLALFIEGQLEESGKRLGYKAMHHMCISQGYACTQETVRLMLHILDPEGVQARKKKRLRRREYRNLGSNYLWHLDGYDKLKQFGMCIHGCVDGFSRKVLWMEVDKTNNDPRIVAGYYLNCVNELGCCPVRLRTDPGTENVVVKDLQQFLRRNHSDAYAGEKSYICGSSTGNQRIESMWNIFRKQKGQYFMDLFHDVKDAGYYSGDLLDKSLMQYTFMELVQVSWTSIKQHTYDSITKFQKLPIAKQTIQHTEQNKITLHV